MAAALTDHGNGNWIWDKILLVGWSHTKKTKTRDGQQKVTTHPFDIHFNHWEPQKTHGQLRLFPGSLTAGPCEACRLWARIDAHTTCWPCQGAMIGRILVPKFPKLCDLATAIHFRSRLPVSYLPLHAQSSCEPQASCSPLKLVSKTGVRKNATSSRHSNRGLVCQLTPSKQESAFPSSWNVDGQIPKENMGKLQTKIHNDTMTKRTVV
ncbi:uncharacterized protein B0T23DRAFT_94491 [Neurospora hispaniola]|uniref:Uncharacterized protein n=1 Tax=Neurospora hispaniola TaxID=588809 RepID=A0AAJ0IDL3_9PEZI|nr:hypothetical protein B0T23DRAFT_94491 [Neurospora hispaniola]